MGAGPYPTEVFGPLADKLREIGREYGTTTGRPRRIGWMDIIALRYACQINGLTHLNITKLDVLDQQDEIQIGVGYKTPDGQLLRSVPADLDTLEAVEVREGGEWECEGNDRGRLGDGRLRRGYGGSSRTAPGKEPCARVKNRRGRGLAGLAHWALPELHRHHPLPYTSNAAAHVTVLRCPLSTSAQPSEEAPWNPR